MGRSRDRITRAVVVMVAGATLVVPATTEVARASGPGRPDTDWSTRGPGTALAATDATSAGELRVRTEARGAGRVGGRPPRPTVARAVASVAWSFPVSSGSYRVTLTYLRITSRLHEDGTGVRARHRRRSSAELLPSSGAGAASGVRRVQGVPRQSSATTRLVLDVAPGSEGRIMVTAGLYARSAANGPRDQALARARVGDVRVAIDKLS